MESFEEMKQRYQQEMMRYAKLAGQQPASAGTPAAEPPPAAPETTPPETPPPAAAEPSAPEPSAPEPSVPQTPPAVPPTPDVILPPKGEGSGENCTHHGPASDREERDTSYGTLTVRVSTAREALPVPGALVLVAREVAVRPTLQWAGRTDISGNTPEIRLPAPEAALSESPGNAHPYASYRIQVDKDGFYTAEFRNVPIFSGVASIQPVELIPYPERESSVKERVVVEREPSDL